MRNRILVVSVLLCAGLNAAVTSVHLVDRTDVPGYAYERVVAKATFAIDPKNPANRIIRDLDYAPKNAAGLVEFSADIFVLKPRNPVEGNGTLLFEVSNRGNKGALSMFNFATGSNDPSKSGDFGDGFLLKQGYTIVWVGWQTDVPLIADRLRLHAPIAKREGQPFTGPVRAEWIVDAKTTTHTLGDRNHIPYPVRNPDDPNLKLTVQDNPDAPRVTIPRAQWRMAREEFGRPVPDATQVFLKAGFVPGKIYELVYEAQDPIIVGLGPAAIRDFISFLKFENAGTILLGEQSRHLKRSIGFGTSQSGRFLRTFVYSGFNRDEKNRKVFDGVWAHVAGGGRGSFNHRFAQPSRDGHPFMNFLYPTDIFPFTDEVQTDAETGVRDGLLTRAKADSVVPKIFYTNGSYEYWGRAASLVHTSLDGKSDLGLSGDSRAYLLTGTQHGPGSFPPRKNNTQNLSNPNDYRFLMRGLLTAMNAWLKDGTPPPPSQIPQAASGQLVTRQAVKFPKIPAVVMPKRVQMAWRANYGPEFPSHGIVTHEPPKLGTAFPVQVPQVDADGNETSGIRLPEIQVPLGTYTGWNLRSAAIGAPTEFFNMAGSFFPFPKNKASQAAAHDPRPSIEERYSSKAVYLEKIQQAARELVQQRFVLAADVPALEQRANRQWDTLAAK